MHDKSSFRFNCVACGPHVASAAARLNMWRMEELRIRWNFLEFPGRSTEAALRHAISRALPSPDRKEMPQQIDRKLRLTAAFLGAVTRKDLAAAFRRVNSATAFDIDRANKWQQGRAQPRQLSVYEDWAKLLELDRPGAWIADCNVEAFADTLCQRHGLARDELDRRADAQNRASSSSAREQRALEISGTYACYSNAWSPYYRGQLIRGVLKIEGKGGGPPGAVATYEELLPTGRLLMEGSIAIARRGMYLSLQEPGGDNQFLYF